MEDRYTLLNETTTIAFNTGVRIGVLFHVGLLVKAFVAERAGEWPDVGVDHEVRGKR